MSRNYQIFIPMREPGEVGHWYLLVVHVKDKTAEIMDSAPNNLRDDMRREAAGLAVKCCSICYESIGS